MDDFPKLNLPSFAIKIIEENGKHMVYDIIRKKYLVLTPEEWVRQHFINVLITHFNYPAGLMRIESGLEYNKLQKRSDVVVYNREGKAFLIAECKAAHQKITQASVEQVAMYNRTIQAPYMILTNGITTFCCQFNKEENTFQFIKEVPTMP